MRRHRDRRRELQQRLAILKQLHERFPECDSRVRHPGMLSKLSGNLVHAGEGKSDASSTDATAASTPRSSAQRSGALARVTGAIGEAQPIPPPADDPRV
jgi:hypothetical protein